MLRALESKLYCPCRAPEGSVDAALSYCHNNLSDNTVLDLLPYLEKRGVALISASFSSMGLLTQKVGFLDKS